ncbi:MarR family winged helix-turn-helix transcriptional regulator [Nocardia vulneris]|uniref:MarR family winged helix-turn-helix transcriptional regulator n=1 Tax=Nocardia vulneris TaxID=1141657 RepID=UPI0009E4D51B|nr:MarR family transcriptional regulator [Nocardia vulneris]
MTESASLGSAAVGSTRRRAAAEEGWAAYQRMRLLVDAEIARDLERSTGLSMPDYDVLAAVAEVAETAECVRVSGLAAHMHWPHSRLSRQLGRMERRELIAREPCERDGRGDDVLLTAAGRRALETAAPAHHASVRHRFTDLLTPAQLRMLAEIEESIARHSDARK